MPDAMPENTFGNIKRDFKTNVESVQALVNFDRTVMDFAIQQVRRLHDRLSPKYANPADNGEHTLLALENVRKNESLRHQYRLIANQGVVLLVSYFESAISDVFRAAMRAAISRGDRQGLLRQKVRMTVDELVSFSAAPDSLADVLPAKLGISFQDMQSTSKAFRQYLGIDLPRDTTVNTVIVAQACRHAIVHRGGIVDRRMVRQLSSATPRDVKAVVREGEGIAFDTDELRTVSDAMLSLVSTAADTASGI